MMFLPPLSFRKRDWRVSELINAGSATDDEMFAAQYGEWPAKGLTKDTPRDDIVNFKGYMAGKRTILGMPFTMAYVNPNIADRDIHINRLTLNPAAPLLGALTSRMAIVRARDLVQSALGVELSLGVGLTILGLSLLSSYRFAIISSVNKLLIPSVADIVGEEHIHVMQFKDGNDITARRAFLNAAHNEIENWTPGHRFINTMKQSLDAVLTFAPREHYAQDHELQARLHNLMVRGYKAWGQIPANEDELIAALADMGIRRPIAVDRYLRDGAQKDLRAIFNKNNQTGYFAPPAGEMNVGLNSFRSETILDDFWRDYLPLLYADLLVKYGDSKGLDRMGYTSDLNLMGLPMKKTPQPVAPASIAGPK